MSIAAGEILDLWFAEQTRPLWFSSTIEFDKELERRFLSSYRAAAASELDDWSATARGSLALVIMLDQFPLNMFRDSPESFSSESKAREIAKIAIDRQQDALLSSEQKAFLYLPFMHS